MSENILDSVEDLASIYQSQSSLNNYFRFVMYTTKIHLMECISICLKAYITGYEIKKLVS